MPQKRSTYWVRSKQINEIGGFGRRPVPAEFETLEEARLYSRQLNLHRGPYHPGYFVEVQEDSPAPFTTGTGKIAIGNRDDSSSGGAMSLAIMSRLVSDVVVVDISGRLCFLEIDLQRQVNELLEQGHRNFVLNLTDVPYIDSFGLGQLITIWTSIRAREGHLVLLRPADHVRQLLQLTKLDSIFQISEDEAQAVGSALATCAALP